MSDKAPFIPYGRQTIEKDDIQAVVEVLNSDWLTTGPVVDRFERELCDYVGATYGVAVANGTAGLHSAVYACDLKPGDEVIVSPITFVASANCILYMGAVPVFADVNRDTLLLNPASVEACITERTKGIIAVDYAGLPCDYDSLRDICRTHGLFLIRDACHSLGASVNGLRRTEADYTVYSFHPVKHITTGEGGMVVTDDPAGNTRLRLFRNHGISTDHRQRSKQGAWFYEMNELGYNYRITDIQCALGIAQLYKLPKWLRRRQEIAHQYDAAFNHMPQLDPIVVSHPSDHAYHLYVIRLDKKYEESHRQRLFEYLRSDGIGVNVHYIPVYYHPYYREKFGYSSGHCPVGESAYERILSLPMYGTLSQSQVERVIGSVIGAVKEVLK